MALAQGAFLNHVARESLDVKGLAKFYQEVFGFEAVETPDFGFDVIWLKLPSLCLHLIKRNPEFMLPEGPFSTTSAVKDPNHLIRGHHMALTISNFDSFVQGLKEKGIQTFLQTFPNRKFKQVFFFDPDGNGLEVSNMEN